MEAEPDTSDEDEGFDIDEYVGKHLLISLTYLDGAGAVREKVQLHGIITRINDAVIGIERQDTGEDFTIPADLSALQVAQAGEYRLKPSGEVVVNPDYLAVWTVGEPGPNAASPVA